VHNGKKVTERLPKVCGIKLAVYRISEQTHGLRVLGG
jgi:hypothetical protein